MAIVERMKWDQERAGWRSGNRRLGSIERGEEFDRIGMWSKFGCYILVERFVLKRIDGCLIFDVWFQAYPPD